MKYEANNPEEYINQLSIERKESIEKLCKTIKDNLPIGFEETISYSMIGYVVPKSIYPEGYHANPNEPLSFINIASQKNHISLYHMGMYMYPDILEWFQDEYTKRTKKKPDMGKSCIRFRKIEDIPYDLIGELCKKISLDDYLTKYKNEIKR